ncbi:MAG: hypothetical protein U0869_07385 [Chloroflexota bacterium]
MSVWYLDLDDEITDAVARLRAAQDDKVVLVLPAGSRIGTGRINFRLLAREAETRGLTLALVSGDPQTRALAASAGIGTHATIADAERALGLAVDDSPTGAQRAASASTVPPATRVSTAVSTNADAATAAATGAAAAAGGSRMGGLLHRGRRDGYTIAPRTATTIGPDGTVVTTPLPGEGARVVRRGPTRRQKAVSWGARGGVLALLAAGGLYVAYLVLPTATVTLTPGTTQIGPEQVNVSARADAAVPDTAKGIVPAVRQQIYLVKSGTYQSSGTQDNLSYATGFVRFTSKNTLISVVIRKGTKVSTNDGRDYQVTEQVLLPKWSGDPPRPTVEAPVKAMVKGKAGNTGPDTITVVPDYLDTQVVSVTNPEAITGGDRVQVKRVTQKDCNNARDALLEQLRQDLRVAAAEPGKSGTRFPDSADLGTPQFTPTCQDLVGQQVDQFDLSVTTTGTVLEVDESQLGTAAQEAFRAAQDPTVRLEPDSIVAAPGGEPTVKADRITFPMDVTARATILFDPETVRREIAGKPVDEAKRILSQYGTALLTIWPDFVPSVPSDANRITLVLQQ